MMAIIMMDFGIDIKMLDIDFVYSLLLVIVIVIMMVMMMIM